MQNKIIFLTIFATFFLISCSISNQDKSDIVDLLKIRETVYNKNNKKAFKYVYSTKWDKYTFTKHQIDFRRVYFKSFSYKMSSFKIVDYNFFFKTATAIVRYNFSFTYPDKQTPFVRMNNKVKIIFKKFDKQWKIINEIKDKNVGFNIPKNILKPALTVLKTRAFAINHKDFELFKTTVAKNHIKYKKIMDDFQKNMKAFDSVNYVLNKRLFLSFDQKTLELKVEQHYNLSIKNKNMKQQTFKNRKEILTLKKIKDKWLIIDGLQ